MAAAPRTRLPAAVVLLGVTSFFTDISGEMIFPLLPVFLSDVLKASPTYLGLVEGAADTVSSLLKLVSGRISDRLAHRKRFVLFGYGFSGSVRPLVALATAPWHVLAVRVSDRIGKGLRSSARDALIADAAPPGAAGRAFGFHSAMDHTGAVLGPLIATALLAQGVPMRQIFAGAAIPSALAFLAILFVREPPRPVPVAASEGPPGALPRRFHAYLGVLAVFSLGNASDAFLLLRAHDVGVSTGTVPLLWMAFHVSKMGSSYFFGALSDRFPRTRLVVAGWAVYAASYLGFAFASQAWQVWALFLFYGLFYGLAEPAEKALVKDLVGAEMRGRAFGAYNFLVGACALPAGLLTGWLWHAFGPAVALGTGAAMAGAASVLLLGWSRGGAAAR